MRKTAIKGSLSLILLMFLTSFAGDTTKPGHRTVWQRVQDARAERQRKRAERQVSIKLIEYRVNKNDSIIGPEFKEAIDSLTKKE